MQQQIDNLHFVKICLVQQHQKSPGRLLISQGNFDPGFYRSQSSWLAAATVSTGGEKTKCRHGEIDTVEI